MFLCEPQRTRLMGAFLALVVLLVYLPVYQFEFINYDDPDYVSSNSHVQESFTFQTVKWAFTTREASNWHPLTWLSHALDWQIFGDKAGGHHFTNVLFHAANAFLLLLILSRMTGAFWPGVFVAALFALHPLHVESVAWVAERKDVLSTFFGLLSLLAYSRYAGSKLAVPKSGPALNAQPSALNYGLSLLAFGCSLMAKPMLVTLPFLLLLLDFWPLQRVTFETGKFIAGLKSSAIRLGLEKLPFFLLVAASSVQTFRAQHEGGAVTPLNALPITVRVSNALISYPRYLWKMIFPSDLAVLYPHPWHWAWWLAVAAAVFLLAVTALIVWQIRQRPFLAVGWFWFIGTLVPVIGLVQVGLQAIADRYTYVPLIGIFVMIAWTAAERLQCQKKLAPVFQVLGATAIGACIVGTSMQLRYWHDSGTLFTHAAKVTKKNFLAHNNLGYYLYNKGKVEEAIENYRKALEAYTGFEVAWNNMGYALANKGQYREAIFHYRKALEINPKHADVHNNLGNALGNVGEDEEALSHYLTALKLKPNHADAHNNLGVALAMRGKLDEGIQHLREAVRLNPKYASARSNLGNALAIQGKTDEAIEQYSVALRLKPDDAQAHNNIGNALSAKGRLDDASAHYFRALTLNTNNPEAHCNLGYVLVKQGKFAEARVHFADALRLKPNYREAQQQLNALEQAMRK